MTVKELLEKLPEARFNLYRQIRHRNGTSEKLFLAYCPNKECVIAEGKSWGFGDYTVEAYGIVKYAKDRPNDPNYDEYELYIKRNRG